MFGPVALSGNVDETGILEYYIYRVDACSRRLGDVLAVVPAIAPPLYSEGSAPVSASGSQYTCCPVDLYVAEVAFELDSNDNSTVAHLMIVPSTTAGFLGVGMATQIELVDNTFEVPTTPRPVTSFAAPILRVGTALGLTMVWIVLAHGVFPTVPHCDGLAQ